MHGLLGQMQCSNRTLLAVVTAASTKAHAGVTCRVFCAHTHTWCFRLRSFGLNFDAGERAHTCMAPSCQSRSLASKARYVYAAGHGQAFRVSFDAVRTYRTCTRVVRLLFAACCMRIIVAFHARLAISHNCSRGKYTKRTGD